MLLHHSHVQYLCLATQPLYIERKYILQIEVHT